MATLPDVCLIFGGNGQVGHALIPWLEEDYTVKSLGRGDCDVTDVDAIAEVIARLRPAVIINATAYNAVDKAESEPELAMSINRDAVVAMARASEAVGAAFVHYSSDYVFDGRARVPYTESDSPGPLGVYAKSKLAGEQAIQAILPPDYPYWILRTSWVFGSHGSNFLKAVLSLAGNRDTLSMVDDQTGTPTSADTIAKITAELLRKRPASGLYHLSCRGLCSRFEYARHILQCAEKNSMKLRLNANFLTPISSAEFPSIAKRPEFSALDSSRLELALGQEMPDWRTEVEKTICNLAEAESI